MSLVKTQLFYALGSSLNNRFMTVIQDVACSFVSEEFYRPMPFENNLLWIKYLFDHEHASTPFSTSKSSKKLLEYMQVNRIILESREQHVNLSYRTDSVEVGHYRIIIIYFQLWPTFLPYIKVP